MTTTSISQRVHLCLYVLMLAAHGWAADPITVSSESQLQNAVANANSTGGNVTILIADGTYTLTGTLQINAPNVTIASVSGNRANVILQGDAMSAGAAIKLLMRVTASNFTVKDLTLRRCGWHLIQMVGENNADNPTIDNIIFRDAYEQMLKVSYDGSGVSSDNGVVRGCLFEYTAGIGPQYYIGGIDAHLSKGWLVSGNTFRNIISPGGSVAEYAVHFWSGAANTVVERNLIVDCDRGIGFGLETRGHTGGIIRNNMIYRSVAKAGAFADVGIELNESPSTLIYNNTVFQEDGFPWSIAYRFASTTNVEVRNNLTNRAIRERDGAIASVSNNLVNAAGSWFVNAAVADLRLTGSVAAPLNTGIFIGGLTNDFDGQARPQGSGIDIGAHELVGSGGNDTTPRGVP